MAIAQTANIIESEQNILMVSWLNKQPSLLIGMGTGAGDLYSLSE